MSNLEVWLIIILIVGIIASNLAVLKHSAKFKMTQFGKPISKPEPNKPTESQAQAQSENKQNVNQNSSDKP